MRRRALLATAAALPLGRGPEARPGPAAVLTGLDCVARRSGEALRGRKVGLVAHAASVDVRGGHAVDLLRQHGVDVIRLFAPEHGLRGLAAAGEAVSAGIDEPSGLPVVSLYGGSGRATAEQLRGLEALVVDLQDVGVRFYTYASTLLLCLDAAVDQGLELVVLDRPNPLGGVRVDGPERDPLRPATPVAMTPGPIVHGLTLGELARYANARRTRPGRLRVVAMQGWSRSMCWEETGRAWVNPSPNLRSAEAAMAYPGTCLLEATSLSEGRGTEAPFLLVGAPWLKAEALAREAATDGFALEPTVFTPIASAAAPRPKFLGRECRGLRLRVRNRAAARPWLLGLRLLAAAKRLQPEFAWLDDGRQIDALVGADVVRLALDRGASAEAVLASCAPALARWQRERRPALLYA